MLNVVVTLPWLALLTSFIGGPNVAVAPLLEWNPNGDAVPAARGRTLRSLSKDARVMALDSDDARRVRLDAGKFFFSVRFATNNQNGVFQNKQWRRSDFSRLLW